MSRVLQAGAIAIVSFVLLAPALDFLLRGRAGPGPPSLMDTGSGAAGPTGCAGRSCPPTSLPAPAAPLLPDGPRPGKGHAEKDEDGAGQGEDEDKKEEEDEGGRDDGKGRGRGKEGKEGKDRDDEDDD